MEREGGYEGVGGEKEEDEVDRTEKGKGEKQRKRGEGRGGRKRDGGGKRGWREENSTPTTPREHSKRHRDFRHTTCSIALFFTTSSVRASLPPWKHSHASQLFPMLSPITSRSSKHRAYADGCPDCSLHDGALPMTLSRHWEGRKLWR